MLLTLPVELCAADPDEKETKAQLDKLQIQIRNLNHELSRAKDRREELLAQLHKADVALGQLARQTRETEVAITANQHELAELENRHQALAARGEAQRKHIAHELATAWKMGRQQQLKVLLNQEDPQSVARSMTYYRYFVDARQRLIAQYRQTLTEFDTVRQDIEDNRNELTRRQSELAEQHTELEQSRQERQIAADHLARDISSKGDELKQLQKNRRELEQLLTTIEQAIIDFELPENFKSFNEGRGQMPWPVVGTPSNRFGSNRNAAGMRWQGLAISARAGTAVHAIHQGRVVYADWFRGSGLLLIIDHGDGYMSLYAHNQSLLREVGEWVKAGAAISTVGAGGALDEPGLYFEIRYQGKPVDPARWCRKN
ncbi:MAG: murein hydrolase activator EnvC family protein [Parahaliea sp.]